MRVVDTSAWIEWLIESPTGQLIAPELPSRDQWVVPTIVQLELSKWLTRERGEDEADRVIAFCQYCVIVPLDTSIALRAASLCAEHRLATADAIILATAQTCGGDLLTYDGHFRGLDPVVLIAKQASL
jgi:predicted nucleic acid-binding protein